MKKIEGFTETILTANPKATNLNLETVRADANSIPQSKFDLIDKRIKDSK